MEKRSVRFGIVTPDGARSSEWLLWWSSKTSDVYIATRLLGGIFKASFHESGQCHVRAPSSGEWLSAGESPRFLDSWNIDPKSNYEFPFALIIPYGELRQAIYREWFVNFRFPGHENVKLVDSPTGQIPEGWEVGVVNDLLKLLSGFAFKSKTFVDDGGYKVVTIKHVHDGEFQTNSMSLLDSPPDRMPAHCHLETADVLMSLTGNIGRSCLVFGENFLLNRSRSQSLHRGLL